MYIVGQGDLNLI